MRIQGILTLVVILFLAADSFAQCPNIGQNPTTAYPVCGTTVFNQTNVPSCPGRNIPGPCGPGLADVNPYWYRFTCYTGGTLGFVITPISAFDDYDWQLFDITGRNPNDVYVDPNLFIACNWSGSTGTTGAVPTGVGLIHCAGGTPINSAMPTITAGHEYLLMVSNFSNSQQGYGLVFTGGTASITDPLAPSVVSATSNCDGTAITVRFNKKMRCNTVAANGSDFTVSGGTVTGATGFGCTTFFDLDSVTLTLAGPLTPGAHTITIATGVDGNTVLDNCGTPVAVGNTTTVNVPTQPPIPMGTLTPPGCAPDVLTLTFAEPIRCNTIAANGSDFTITGPTAVTIASATSAPCNGNGETQIIYVNLTSPILTGGNYQLQVTQGSDGNTLVGQCSRPVSAGSSVPFTLASQAAIPMGAATASACAPTYVTLTFTDPINCTSVATNGSDFLITGPSPVNIASATAMNCNAAGETNTITIQLTGPILVAGTYQVQATAGSDGNTLLGLCGRQVTAGSTSPLVLPPQPAIPMGTIGTLPCAPATITLTFADVINCNSIAANGSDFTITGPSTVAITSATAVNCNTAGETNTITLQLSAPILITGNYQVVVGTGADGNTLTGACGRQVTAGSSTPLVLPPQPVLPMGSIAQPACVPQTITLSFPDPVFCSSIASDGSDFVVTGPAAVAVTSATPVNCNANGETNTVTLQFSSPILVLGTYQVAVAQGSDGNTLIGSCGRQVAAGSTAGFTLAAQPPLPMGTVVQPGCSPSSIVIDFPENFGCMSIAANGSDFIITGPSAVTIVSAAGQCNINPLVRTVTVGLASPIIVSGTYQVQMVNGTDGNTLLGECNNGVPVGATASFEIPPASPVAMDSIVPVACSPSSLRLIFDAPVKCGSIAANGSDFALTGPSAVTITGASGTCDANGLTTSLDIQLSAPIVTGGIYTLQLQQGSDGNTLLSDCDRPSPVASLSFEAFDTVSATFQYQVLYDCETDTLTFTHPGLNGVNEWTWSVNGDVEASTQNFTRNFSASSQSAVQLVVSNGVCTDTYTENIVLNNKVVAAIGGPDVFCPEDTVSFTDLSTGDIDSWSWNFGNGNTSAVAIPPTQVYPLTGVETIYPISLTVGNNTGCQTTVTKNVRVLGGCIIAVPTAFTPNNDGLNDYLFPLNGIKAEDLDFKVFNRWGQLLFRSREWTQKWDGTVNGIPQATNVYIWTLNYTHRDTGEKYSLKGTVTLIR